MKTGEYVARKHGRRWWRCWCGWLQPRRAALGFDNCARCRTPEPNIPPTGEARQAAYRAALAKLRTGGGLGNVQGRDGTGRANNPPPPPLGTPVRVGPPSAETGGGLRDARGRDVTETTGIIDTTCTVEEIRQDDKSKSGLMRREPETAAVPRAAPDPCPTCGTERHGASCGRPECLTAARERFRATLKGLASNRPKWARRRNR